MNVELIEYPTNKDWMACKKRASITMWKKPVNPPNIVWKRHILEARHSPIRRLYFSFELTGIPSWVSVHLVRHIHAQPYVASQRNDRQEMYNREEAPQSAPVNMIWDMNAEELMTIANKRLCNKASKETREVVQAMCAEVLKKCPEFEGLLVPMCQYHGGVCHEMQPCSK